MWQWEEQVDTSEVRLHHINTYCHDQAHACYAISGEERAHVH